MIGRRAIAIFFAIGGAALAHYIALALGGAGHGWTQPFFFSFALWLLLPLTAIRAGNRKSGRSEAAAANISLAALALILDVALVVSTKVSGDEHFENVANLFPPLVMAWIAIWLSWQVPTIWMAITPMETEEP